MITNHRSWKASR